MKIPQTGNVVGQDVDGDSLTYTVSTNPSHGTVSIDSATGGYTYTPNANYNGSDSFEVTVADGKGGTTTITIPVTVTAVNDAPVAQATTASGNEDNIIVSLSGTDIDVQSASFKLSILPANGKLLQQLCWDRHCVNDDRCDHSDFKWRDDLLQTECRWNGSTNFQYSEPTTMV
jgi:VCBS repeat-containing protein